MSSTTLSAPPWTRTTLRLAGVYNLVWGIWIILFPLHPFQLLEIAAPNYPSLVQCLGMVIGVYGIGYWIAADDSATHWPIVLVGLLGKVFGPIGFVYCAAAGQLPWGMGIGVLTNDLIWWIPFVSILIHAARVNEAKRRVSDRLTIDQALKMARTNDGQSLFDRSFQAPLLIVCVRHYGCAFCRETLADLASHRSGLTSNGLSPVVVSMGTNQQAEQWLRKYGLGDVAHVSDPERRLYRALELPFGTLQQVLNWDGIRRALWEGVLFRFGLGPIVGNALQLPGAFVIKNGQIERAVRHSTSSERFDFTGIGCDIA